MCANQGHKTVLVHFLEQIQNYIDEITENDEDFEMFLNVLEELIEKSNDDVVFSFLGGEYTEKWMKTLPMTVYYAVIGYMHMIDVTLLDLIDTTERLNNLVNETLDSLDYIDCSGDDYHKICLN